MHAGQQHYFSCSNFSLVSNTKSLLRPVTTELRYRESRSKFGTFGDMLHCLLLSVSQAKSHMGSLVNTSGDNLSALAIERRCKNLPQSDEQDSLSA